MMSNTKINTEIRTYFCKYQLLSLYLYYGSYTQYK